MSPHDVIIDGILHHIEKSGQPDAQEWNIGLASDLHSAYESWERPGDLHYWSADTPEDARAVETYCVHVKGMRSMTADGQDPEEQVYICLFTAPGGPL